MSEDIFVIGMDEANLPTLRAAGAGRDCRFHGLLTIEELQGGEVSVPDLLARARRVLDAFGRVTSWTDANGGVHTQVFDRLGLAFGPLPLDLHAPMVQVAPIRIDEAAFQQQLRGGRSARGRTDDAPAPAIQLRRSGVGAAGSSVASACRRYSARTKTLKALAMTSSRSASTTADHPGRPASGGAQSGSSNRMPWRRASSKPKRA